MAKTLDWIEGHLMALETDACVTWPFARCSGRYGHLQVNKVYYLAHRLVCEMAHGPAPDGSPLALHSCHNGEEGCVNPRHLRWGTAQENTADIRNAGRMAIGERLHKSNLTESDVQEIRKLRDAGVTLQRIADDFGISPSAVCSIAKRRSWSHVA